MGFERGREVGRKWAGGMEGRRGGGEGGREELLYDMGKFDWKEGGYCMIWVVGLECLAFFDFF